MTITDFIVFILSVFFIIRGSSRGFMRSLLGPFSIVAATILSIIYYQITNNMIISLLIGLFGPLLLSLLLKFLLASWAQFTNTPVNPGLLSRLGGAVLTLVWGWVFIIFTLILLAVLPPWGEKLTAVHNDVTGSGSYYLIKPFKDTFFAPPKQNVTNVAPASPSSDARSLAQDPRFQKILQDPDIQNEIEAHDLVKLMSNPKMMELTKEIMSDPATMKKVLAIYGSQKQPLANTTPSEPSQ